MWKKRILCLVLVLCACLLAACQQEKVIYPTQDRPETQQPAAQEAPAAQPDTGNSQNVFPNYDDGSYNPASEEGGDEEYIAIANPATPVPTVNNSYAGATPVVIDPIDKPTPTPVPTMKFTYSKYEAEALHLSFEAPVGWTVDNSAADTYILTDEADQLDVQPKVMVRVVPVNKNYNKNELTKEVKAALDTIRGEGGFSSFDPSSTATRTFIDGNGVYMAYKGTLSDGRGVAGRVIVNTVDKVLYILHVSYPRSMADNFAEGVYNKVRSTMKKTN